MCERSLGAGYNVLIKLLGSSKATALELKKAFKNSAGNDRSSFPRFKEKTMWKYLDVNLADTGLYKAQISFSNSKL